MRLSRAIGRQAKTPVYYWDPIGYEWLDSGLRARLQVYDRFISERSFGQKKRILTLSGLATIEDDKSIIRLGDSETVFLVESLNEDIEGDTVYASTYSVREAPYEVDLCNRAKTTAASGLEVLGAEQVLATTWVDIERYSAVDSREFANTDYTIFTVSFPKGLTLSTDTYLRRKSDGMVLDINELFFNLELPAARCQRRG